MVVGRDQTLEALLDAALELPPSERAAWLDAQPEGPLKPYVRELLTRAERLSAERFRDSLPPVDDDPPGRGGDTIGPYRLVRELGAGGMGALWLAERHDGLPGRPVAILLPHGSWPRAGLAERLSRERDIRASLDHPSIARLHDAGVTAAGQPYLAFEHVEGRRIDDYCREEGLDVRARLGLFLQLAGAVAHAHGRRVVHGALEPANILVDAGGSVRLLDLGIAKLSGGGGAIDTGLTRAAGRPPTPRYASPEQLTGAPLTVASDVYSLGLVLYDLLTDRPAHDRGDATPGAVEDVVRRVAPPAPSAVVREPRVRRALRGDLDTVVQVAIEQEPARRYPTVAALAADVQRCLEGRPVQARAGTTWHRPGKLLARRRVAVAAGGVVALVIAAGAGLALRDARVARDEARRANEVKSFLADLLVDTDPHGPSGRSLTVDDLMRRAKRRVDDMPLAPAAVRVELLNTLGWALLGQQNTALAEQVITEAVNEAGRGLGPQHRERLRARVLLSTVRRLEGRSAETRAQLDALVPELRDSEEAYRVDLVRALRNRANLALHEGRYAEAVADAREAMTLAARSFGVDHPESATSADVLALALIYAGQPGEAVSAADDAHRP